MRVRVQESTNGIVGRAHEKRLVLVLGGHPKRSGGLACESLSSDRRFRAESTRGRVQRAVTAQAAAVTTVQEAKSAASVKVTVKTRLCIQHQVAFGSSLKVVGAGPEFGDWQAEKAVALLWNEGHVWSVDLDLEPGSYEFKCVIAAGDHITAWEDGINRIVQVPNGVRGIRVDGSWCRTADNGITVTEPLAAASVAARQKRAAAARLLSKALAEVSAAAAASPPSAAVIEGRKAAASVKRPDGSKAAAAAELEREAKETLRELGELLSSDVAGVESSLSLTRVRKADKAGAGSESKSSSGAAVEAKPDQAAASSSSSTSTKASKAASWRDILSEEPPKQEQQAEKAKPADTKQAEPAEKPAPAAAAEANSSGPSSAKAEPEVPDRWAFVKKAAAAPAAAAPAAAAAAAAEVKPAGSGAASADAGKAEPSKAAKSEQPAAPVKEQPTVAKPAAAEVPAAKPAAPSAVATEAAGKRAAAKAQEKPAAESKPEKQPEQKKAPESSSGVSRFGGLLAKLGGSLGLAQQPEEAKSSKAEAAPASNAPASSAPANSAPANSAPANSAPANSAPASAPESASSSAGTSPASSSTSSSTSSGGRKFSWRSLGDEADEGKKQEEQKEQPATEAKPAAPEAGASDAKQPEPEEDTASRFARLLKAKQEKAGGSSGSSGSSGSAVAAPDAPKQEKSAAAEKKPEPAAVAEPAKKEEQKKKEEKAVVEAKQQQDKAVAAAEPKGQKPGAAVDSSSTAAAESDAAAMGANNSKQVETVQDEGLDRLMKAWDSAWSKGKKGAAAVVEDAAADGPSTSSSAPTPAPTSSGGRRNWASLEADDGPSTSAAGSGKQAQQQQPQRTGISAALGPAAAAAAKTANGGTPPIGSGSGGAGGSSSESLFTIAERATSNAPVATPTAVPDDASPDVTMRKGALAAMQVDRQGSYDNRSSYLSQSLLQESLAGGNGPAGGNGNAAAAAADGPSSSTLLQKLRAANAARGAGGSGSAANGTATNGGAANGTFVPPLPATPAPPGILSSNDDDDGEMLPPLPATPPPPSYLTGPSGGKGAPMGDVGPVVPPLPATPVASSVLGGADSGGSEGKGKGAEELLRRAHDADKVLAMLRGNLPLTPIARGGRGGAGAGPLSMADAEEGEDDDDDGSVGHSRKPVEPHPQADPVAATQRAIADAVHAWDKTRAALAALQQSAAELGLSPGAIQEQAAKLLQNMPRAIGTDGSAGAAGAANGQPNAIPMTAQLGNLMNGLGLSASSIAEQLTRKSLDGSEQGGGLGGGMGLISGLLGGLTGNNPLPPGCVRLVAGAHMIPHVDKVDKGGEDAYFISRVGLGGVGVADGVSGWADEGIDPAEYPRTLMRYATDAYEAARGTLSAQDIIRYSQYRTYLKGSSTVCLALMKPNKQLEIANVGDSGVRILRNGKVIFGTEAQQHAFNMPFQLSHPNNVEDPDSADDADVHLVEVQDGDVIMLATDGLFDNVFDDEIEQIVSHQLRELAAQGRGKAPTAPVSLMTIGAGPPLPEVASTSAASNGSTSAPAGSSGSSNAAPGAGGGTGAARPRGAGLLSQSLNAAAASAGTKPGTYRAEDAARVARALAERAHLHARNPTQRTPWSVTSSQQPNFMWAKFFAKGGGKMDDCTVLVAFVCSE
ncbi:hypothetical protein HXX76_004382 [Chlamydomonas incerta]|uniref:Protein-serine/threonine phosphatase n=1 Tax=Chlamydomonas incerta TaxID=51695 RepID=A0A835TM69_CHLIN|nr:hypothetical protein HXX76_004382 [Chlamydomonas incerta]|eukprot:KAG2440270.1 hypothetical protein HXX76_004382 [Chlamydomonas incerta]